MLDPDEYYDNMVNKTNDQLEFIDSQPQNIRNTIDNEDICANANEIIGYPDEQDMS